MSNLISFHLFDPPMFGLVSLGCFLWALLYVIVVVNIVKHKFVEVPAMGVCGNIGWEFVWGIVFGNTVTQNMGTLFSYGYGAWFFLDVFIFYSLLRYGHKQITTPELIKYFKPTCILAVAAWGFGTYFYRTQGLDTPVGTITAYFDGIMLSALYIVLILKQPDVRFFSVWIGWLKLFGTGFVSIGVSLKWSDNYFLITLCAINFILDLAYIFAYRYRVHSRGHKEGFRIA